jgi:hypothetical protein
MLCVAPMKRQTAEQPILLDTVRQGDASCPMTVSVDRVTQNATDLLVTYSYALLTTALLRDTSEDGSDDTAPPPDPLTLFGKQHRLIVEYTPDGLVWRPLETIALQELRGSTQLFAVPLTELDGPTSEARVRISPIGGATPTLEPCFSDESSTFTVGNRMPTAYVVWPTDGAEISLDDVQVTRAKFQWFDS